MICTGETTSLPHLRRRCFRRNWLWTEKWYPDVAQPEVCHSKYAWGRYRYTCETCGTCRTGQCLSPPENQSLWQMVSCGVPSSCDKSCAEKQEMNKLKSRRTPRQGCVDEYEIYAGYHSRTWQTKRCLSIHPSPPSRSLILHVT